MDQKLQHDELRALYDESYAHRLNARNHAIRLRRLVSNMPLRRTDDVADFACGSGALLDYVHSLVRSYVGVDFSPAFIQLARERKERLQAANAEFCCASIEEFCAARAQQFDAAFAFDFSEHVYDEEWVSLLTHIRSALRPQGRLYLHTPNAAFVLERMKAHNFILKQSPEHIAVRTGEANVALLQRAGFQAVRVKFLPHYNMLRWVHPFSFLPLIGASLKARLFVEAVAP